jgi:glycopeptide antibiotics resistance protein
MYAASGVQGYAPWAGRVSAGGWVVVVLGLAGLIVVDRVVVGFGPLAPLAWPGAVWGILARSGAVCRPWSSPAGAVTFGQFVGLYLYDLLAGELRLAFLRIRMDIQMTLPTPLVLLALSAIAGALLLWQIVVRGRRFTAAQLVVLAVFLIYLLAVVAVVLLPIEVALGKYAALTPWYSSVKPIPLLTIDAKTFLLNMIMTIPLGVFLSLLRPAATMGAIARQGFAASVILELLQLLLMVTLGSARSIDSNDLLANTLGALIGAVLVRQLQRVPSVRRLLAASSVSSPRRTR